MELTARLERMLKAYSHYYDIEQDSALCHGFAATAIYHLRDENYILNKANTVYATEQHEYVYFAVAEHVDKAQAQHWIDQSRTQGLKLIHPHKEHMFSYVTLMVIANTIDADAKKLLKRYTYSKQYRLSLHGWMEYHIAAMEVETMSFLSNPVGKKARQNLRENFASEV
ncbi:hypothetical protein RFF05_06015 [Bengtsoniella intestinalis]|uniref:hypothetical protein n=1 Tax=Bengtsoniella intestinalis TaxID=3073143 RepID=UPI00391F1AFB